MQGLTLEQLEHVMYGGRRSKYVEKADDPYLKTTPNTFQARYGAEFYVAFETDGGPSGFFPKSTWHKSGFGMETAYSQITAVSDKITKYGATVEGGDIADTQKSTYNRFTVEPKLVQRPFNSSAIREALAKGSTDDMLGGLDVIRRRQMNIFLREIGEMMTLDVEGQAAGASGDFGGEKLNWETIDRAISNDEEEDALGGTHDDWYDYLDQMDRDANNDAYNSSVLSCSPGTFGSSNGHLEREHFQKLISQIVSKCMEPPNYFMCATEVYPDIIALYENQLRYSTSEGMVEMGRMGIKPATTGTAVSMNVAMVSGIPLVQTNRKTAYATDTKEAGRIFAINTNDSQGMGMPNLGIQMLMPATYSENTPGSSRSWPWNRGKFTHDALYYMVGELVCPAPRYQGKIRDIELRI